MFGGVAGDAVGGDEEELGGDGFFGAGVVGGDLLADLGEDFLVLRREGEEEFVGGDGGVEGGAEVLAQDGMQFGEEDARGVVFFGGDEQEHGVAFGAVNFHGVVVGVGDEVFERLLVEGLRVDFPAAGVGGGDGALGFAIFEEVGDGEVIHPGFVEQVRIMEAVVGEEGGEDVLPGGAPGVGALGGGEVALDFGEEGFDVGGEILGGGEVAAVEGG